MDKCEAAESVPQWEIRTQCTMPVNTINQLELRGQANDLSLIGRLKSNACKSAVEKAWGMLENDSGLSPKLKNECLDKNRSIFFDFLYKEAMTILNSGSWKESFSMGVYFNNGKILVFYSSGDFYTNSRYYELLYAISNALTSKLYDRGCSELRKGC